MMEFLSSHTSVLTQLPFNHPAYSGINPYALGFAIYSDLKRVCENPTEEDKSWFPDIAGGDWLEVLHTAMRDFKDESFVLQFLSPKVMRDLRLFGVVDDDQKDHIRVEAIHDEAGYKDLRMLLASQYNMGDKEPNIQVVNVDLRGDRSITLRHNQFERRPMSQSTDDVMKHLYRLWKFPVKLESVWEGSVVDTFSMPKVAEVAAGEDSNFLTPY